MDPNSLVFENPDIVAFIKINQGISPRLSLRADGKVVFCFDQDVTKSLDDFSNNKPVGVQAYANAIRSIRSLMYAFKGGAGR
jgi:hypothetical protein